MLGGDVALIPYLKGDVTRTMPSITSLQEHGVRWHPAAIAGYVYCPPILWVTAKTVHRFAILRKALCTTFLTRTTMSPCCYLCTAPLAVSELFLISRLLDRSGYDSHACKILYYWRPLSWRIIFLYCTSLYYFVSCHCSHSHYQHWLECTVSSRVGSTRHINLSNCVNDRCSHAFVSRCSALAVRRGQSIES